MTYLPADFSESGVLKFYIPQQPTNLSSVFWVNSLTCEHRRSASYGSRSGHRPLRWIMECPIGTIWIWHGWCVNHWIPPLGVKGYDKLSSHICGLIPWKDELVPWLDTAQSPCGMDEPKKGISLFCLTQTSQPQSCQNKPESSIDSHSFFLSRLVAILCQPNRVQLPCHFAISCLLAEWLIKYAYQEKFAFQMLMNPSVGTKLVFRVAHTFHCQFVQPCFPPVRFRNRWDRNTLWPTS